MQDRLSVKLLNCHIFVALEFTCSTLDTGSVGETKKDITTKSKTILNLCKIIKSPCSMVVFRPQQNSQI